LPEIAAYRIIPNSSVNGEYVSIDGGTTAGQNLFHSFQEFSLSTGTQAYFNNPATINNIITRITGANFSDIDGLIRANGNANLFLINPNGISFGPNAKLAICGSCIASAADQLLFNHVSGFLVPKTQKHHHC
jgi:filamentous hemagglutinin family protein